MDVLDPEFTVVDAREMIRRGAEKGMKCPCCDQNVKIYKRPLNHVPAAAMVALYRDHHTDWAHMPTVMQTLPSLAGQGGYAVLGQHWDLIEEQRSERPDGGRAGWWRLTMRGLMFVTGGFFVPKFARIYNGEKLGLEGPDISVGMALGSKFSLNELMAA